MAISRSLCLCLVILTLGIVAGVITVLVLLARTSEPSCPGGFQHAAVAADSPTCSDIGSDILKRGGSAVDSAIAALLCCSIMNPQSMGIGGGVVFTIYNASTGHVEVINARETAPAGTPGNLADGCRASQQLFFPGTKWIGVPGELRGYEVAHKRHGKLPWRTLFQPTINLAINGFPVSPVLNSFLNHTYIKNLVMSSSLCKVYCRDGDVLRSGDILKLPKLAETLRIVAESGAGAFYEGPLAQRMVEDIEVAANKEKAAGVKLTLDDFRNFQVDTKPALNMPLGKYSLYTAPPPYAGAILSFILNILKGYHFTPDSVKGGSAKVETYHRIIEALKFANGQKSKLQDPNFTNVKKAIESLLSDSLADLARSRIDDFGNHSLSYYNISQPGWDGLGTSHISVIAEDGSAVSVTSTINYVFGSRIYSEQTGIIFNNELADFCKMAPGRRVIPGERPPSAMTPSILISNDKKTKLVIGGAGGDMITSATALAIINKLWLGYDLQKAISTGTFYVNAANKLFSEDLQKDPSAFEELKLGLQAKGHSFSTNPFFMNVVQAVAQEDRCLYAESDKRKYSRAAGY